MVSRFILLLALSRFLEPSDVGLYGLFMATVIFSWQLVGGEIYSYGNRDMLQRSREQWSFVVQHMALAIGILYVCVLPALSLLFQFGVLPSGLAGWFFAILVCEHLSQEAHRILNFMGRPIRAGVVLCFRSGVWVWGAIIAMWLWPDTRILDTVFSYWLIGAGFAAVLGAVLIYREIPDWRIWPIDFSWLKRGFQVGGLFLLSALCFRVTTTVDQYMVLHLVGDTLLGVYVLYISMAMAIISILQPAVLAFLMPRLVTAYHNGDEQEYQRILRELTWSLLGLTVVMALVAAAAAPWVLEWTERDIYTDHLPLLWVLLGAAVAYAAGLVPQSGLYAMRKDKSILIANISSLIIFAILTVGLAAVLPLFAVPLGLLGSFVWVCLFRIWLYRAI